LTLIFNFASAAATISGLPRYYYSPNTSTLTLLVLWIFRTDDPDDTPAAYHLAPVTHRFYWRPDFHFLCSLCL